MTGDPSCRLWRRVVLQAWHDAFELPTIHLWQAREQSDARKWLVEDGEHGRQRRLVCEYAGLDERMVRLAALARLRALEEDVWTPVRRVRRLPGVDTKLPWGARGLLNGSRNERPAKAVIDGGLVPVGPAGDGSS